MGKLLIYWLVAKVPDVAKIYVLARKDPQKEGICVEDRLSEILASPPFDSLRAKISNFEQEMAQKIIIVKANLMEKGLGLESNAKQKLIEEVQILIHAAASSDWQESLQTSFRCNVVASLELMELAHQMLKLCVFLHVSSAFFMGRPLDSKIEERVYPLPFDAEMMYKKLCDCPADKMDKEWTKLQPIFHTTHSFTKALIEVLLDNRRQNIPLAIIRPTILGATYREPFPGWVDSLNVIGVLFIYTALGIVQILPGRLDYTLDIVPCDYVVHAIFSIIFQLKSNSSKDDGEFGPASQVPIFFISSSSNPLTWKFAIGTMQKYWQSTLPAKPQGSPKISVYRNYLFYQEIVETHLSAN
ncbi:fatty acyl-CoA reductase 1-like [Schistocerca gregaria]|uniref:fatty acyl-CoA reductase 1-like n=1 Tax=Schistocerca gregaria TaxID=7010 RepID=UPI00211DB243|nr:fatty acyl-CoA reductase 1-like [Schistocerca gregaria]